MNRRSFLANSIRRFSVVYTDSLHEMAFCLRATDTEARQGFGRLEWNLGGKFHQGEVNLLL